MNRNNRDKQGFTLAELLVVVAIIAVLVAIAIPIFTSQLEKSREATDAANIRSQYAQVMTDAITEGGNVNGKDVYGIINLNQKKENWQDTTTGTNLHGLFQEVDGHPVPNGTAWVEYKASESKVILHYEGEGGSNGGSSSGDSTGGNGGSSGGTSGSTGSVNFDSSAIDWDKDVKPLDEYTIQIGEIYKSNNNYYFGRANEKLNKWQLENYTLDKDFTPWKLVKYTGKVWNITDFNSQRNDVNQGDLCKTSDGYYTYIDGGNTTNGPDASGSKHQWIKVNIR